MTAADASSLARWEWVETIGWLAVIIGCLGEGIAEFTKWPEDDKKRHRLGKSSWLILIAGLALEFWGSGRISHIKDLEVARLNKGTEEAKRARIELERQVEVLRNKNLELTVKLQDRAISPEMRSSLLSCFADGPKGKVTFIAGFADGESQKFQALISAVMKDAGFTVVPYVSKTIALTVSAPGVTVSCRELDKPPMHAQSIVDCLKKTLNAEARQVAVDCDLDTVVIVVGPRF